jgi:A/G-specific adenine glycosylase
VALRENRIAELPPARKRKPLPLKRATWLVLQHQGAVLLERRPSAGLWGGLWVFPEGPASGLRSYCRKTFAIEVGDPRRLEIIEHGFTHFRLRIQPLRCGVRRKLPLAEAPGRTWLDIEDAARAAVPAPVRALLSGLLRDQAV